MFSLDVGASPDEAASLLGVRISAILIGLGALATTACCVLLIIIGVISIKQHELVDGLKFILAFLFFVALSYVLLRICTGLFEGRRFAQIGGVAWGVVLLLFCWLLAHDARGPYNPKAPDAQELDGPMFLLAAPTGLWLIGYLSTRRVSAKFLNSQSKVH